MVMDNIKPSISKWIQYLKDEQPPDVMRDKLNELVDFIWKEAYIEDTFDPYEYAKVQGWQAVGHTKTCAGDFIGDKPVQFPIILGWMVPGYGFVSPDKVKGVAESYGLQTS